MFINALLGKNKERPPIWLMRQAGRYSPSYQKIRENRTLKSLFLDPHSIVKITELPIQELSVDAAIVFSDILMVCEGLGAAWEFDDKKGPILGAINSAKKSSYKPVQEAILELKKRLNVPLIGFCGAPFTVATYLIEGGSSKEYHKTKKWLFEDPKGFKAYLKQITDETLNYVEMQVRSGCNAIQIFESSSQALGINEFREFALPTLREIIQKLSPTPVILFSRSSLFLEDLAALNPTALSCDWTVDLKEVRSKIPSTIALQGNLDPTILLTSPSVIEKHAKKLLHDMEADPSYIFNLGHGILKETPLSHVKHLVETVKNFSGRALSTP